jgi:hypothetical protein
MSTPRKHVALCIIVERRDTIRYVRFKFAKNRDLMTTPETCNIERCMAKIPRPRHNPQARMLTALAGCALLAILLGSARADDMLARLHDRPHPGLHTCMHCWMLQTNDGVFSCSRRQ